MIQYEQDGRSMPCVSCTSGRDTKMTTERFENDVGRTVRSLFRPEAPVPSATPRVAVLYPGDGTLAKAVADAGLEVTYSHTPEDEHDKLDISKLPLFDLIAANLPDDDQGREDVLEFVFRFLWVRRPVAFLLVGNERGESTERGLVARIESKYERMGYYNVQRASSIPGVGMPGEERLTYFLGTLIEEGFPWPGLLVRPRRNEETEQAGVEGGSEDDPPKSIPGVRHLVSVRQEIILRTGRFIREDI